MKAKRLSKEEWKNQKNREKKALDNKLGNFLKEAIETKEGMDKLTAHYRISGLYTYSFCNSLLICLQGGTIAQSFNGWKKLDRTVNKGEKGKIQIFVPFFKKEKDEETGEEKQVVKGFNLKPVFDIEQTEGKELEYDHNTDIEMSVDYSKVAKVMSKITKAKIKETYTGNARGSSDGKELTVSKMSNDIDKAKTLIHETVHHLIHTGDKKEAKISRETKEVEAESTAYLVMSYLGMNYELSKNYVQSWKSGINEARHHLIIKTADKLIKALKKELTQDELFLAKI